MRLMHQLFKQPVVGAKEVSEMIGVTMVTAYKLIGDLVELSIFEEVQTSQRGKRYTFREYLDLFA